jgi:hypothetical protein
MTLLLLAMATLDPQLEEYAAVATGRFSSVAQHRRDARYDEVEARVVRIWPDREDGLWLYQEQAIVNRPGMTRLQALATPYFQFVARIVPLKRGSFRRDNFRLLANRPFKRMNSRGPDTIKLPVFRPFRCRHTSNLNVDS